MSAFEDSVRITQDVVEVLFAAVTRSPTTVTGAGVSQDVVEVLFAPGPEAPAVGGGETVAVFAA